MELYFFGFFWPANLPKLLQIGTFVHNFKKAVYNYVLKSLEQMLPGNSFHGLPSEVYQDLDISICLWFIFLQDKMFFIETDLISKFDEFHKMVWRNLL